MDCKQCKGTLGFVLFKNATQHLEKAKKIVLAGCFSGANEDDSHIVSGVAVPQITQQYRSNALESDMRF